MKSQVIASQPHTWLIQAAFLSGQSALAAWEQWRTQTDFEDLDWESYQLLPHLYENLQQHQVQNPLMPRMKGIQKLFWCKNQVALAGLETAIAALQAAGCKAMIVTTPWCSTCGQYQSIGLFDRLELQITPEDSDKMLSILQSLGWFSDAVDPKVSLEWAGSLYLKHNDYPDIILYQALSSWYDMPAFMDSCLDRAVPSTIGNTICSNWSITDQVIYHLIPKKHLNDSADISLPTLAYLITLLLSPDLDTAQLIEAASKHQLLYPLYQRLRIIQDLGITLPASLANLEESALSIVERCQYALMMNNYTYKVGTILRRHTQFTIKRLLQTPTSVASQSAEPLTPEWQLLLTCTALYFNPTVHDRTSELLQQLKYWPQYWPALVKLAAKHGLTALLGHNLKTYCAEVVSPATLRALQVNAQGNRLRNIFLTQNLAKLLDQLKAQGITVIPYKGATLTQLAYADLRLRKFNDLDILVRPQDRRKLGAFLQAQGYIQQVDYFWEESWSHPTLNIEIDVHQSLVPLELFPTLSYQKLQASQTLIKFAAPELENVEVPAINRETLFFLLCFYVIKDYATWHLKLGQLVDIAALVQQQPDMDWKEILQTAQRSGYLRIVLLQFTVLQELFGIEPPAIFQDRIKQDRSLDQLSRSVIHRLMLPEADFPEQSVRFLWPFQVDDHLFCLRIRERWRDRLWYGVLWLVSYGKFVPSLMTNPFLINTFRTYILAGVTSFWARMKLRWVKQA
jgi:hypothetical protein